jgi:hypothetical protein
MRTAAAALAALALAAPLGAQEHRPAPPADSTAPAARCPAGMMLMMQEMGMMGSGMKRGETPDPGISGEMMRMATVMADVMRFEPRHVLAAGDGLELTSAQVRQLERLVAVREAAHRGARQGMSWTEVRDALDAQEPDTAAVRRAAENTLAHSSALHVRMAVDAAAVKALLSPDQREKVPAPEGCPALPHPDSGEGHHDDSH